MVTDIRKESKAERADFWRVINALRGNINQIDKKAERGVTETRVREIMKEEMEPLRADIRSLSIAVNEIPLKLQESIHQLELKIITGKSKHE